jgi:hypothetical protein
MRRNLSTVFNYTRSPDGGAGLSNLSGVNFGKWGDFVSGPSEVYIVKAFGASYLYNSGTKKRRSIDAVFEIPFQVYREYNSSDFSALNGFTTVNGSPSLVFYSGTQFFYRIDPRLNLINEPALSVAVRSFSPTDAVDFDAFDVVFFAVNLEFEIF